MPNRDGTGPNGQGSKTGRGVGKCSKSTNDTPIEETTSSEEESSETTFGKRDGSGCGKGRGAGNNGAGRRCCGK